MKQLSLKVKHQEPLHPHDGNIEVGKKFGIKLQAAFMARRRDPSSPLLPLHNTLFTRQFQALSLSSSASSSRTAYDKFNQKITKKKWQLF